MNYFSYIVLHVKLLVGDLPRVSETGYTLSVLPVNLEKDLILGLHLTSHV